jgi:hypothetical protein
MNSFEILFITQHESIQFWTSQYSRQMSAKLFIDVKDSVNLSAAVMSTEAISMEDSR